VGSDGAKAESVMPIYRVFLVTWKPEALYSVLPVNRLVPSWGENAAWKGYFDP